MLWGHACKSTCKRMQLRGHLGDVSFTGHGGCKSFTSGVVAGVCQASRAAPAV
jgi:hypothetical protein